MATRCTACATVFRVVPDQLRVSEGWVRCGRCAEVFNAVEQMVDVAADDRADAGRAAAEEAWAAPAAELMRSPRPGVVAQAMADVQVGTHGGVRPEATAQAMLPGPEAAMNTPTAEAAAPRFVQQADRAARWRRPGIKAALWVAATAGLVGLMLQLGIEYRDLVGARWPSSLPLLEQVCRVGNCRIEPPRMIDALVVDSSGLVRVEGTNMYRFSVVLRNRAAMPLAMPAVDLSLTDAQGRVIARRTLVAGELGASSSTIAAATELPLQATLGVLDRPVSGYTIEIFYP